MLDANTESNLSYDRSQFLGQTIGKVTEAVDPLRVEITTLWTVEEMFARLLTLHLEKQGLPTVKYLRRPTTNTPNNVNFSLDTEFGSLHRNATVGRGNLDLRSVRFPTDINAEYPHTYGLGKGESYISPDNSALINYRLVPSLMDLFGQLGFSVVRRDKFFVPDEDLASYEGKEYSPWRQHSNGKPGNLNPQ